MIQCNKCGKVVGECECEPNPGLNCLGCGSINNFHYCDNPRCYYYEGPKLSRGDYIQNVVLVLTAEWGWAEHANALLYTQGAPALMNVLLECYDKELNPFEAAKQVNLTHCNA